MAELKATFSMSANSLNILEEHDNDSNPSDPANSGYLRLVESNEDDTFTVGIYAEIRDYSSSEFNKFATRFFSLINDKLGDENKIPENATNDQIITSVSSEMREDVVKAAKTILEIATTSPKDIKLTTFTDTNKPVMFGDSPVFESQYDVDYDWNNDVATIKMFKVEGLLRVEMTFDVDGMSDTGWEAAAKWIIILDPDQQGLTNQIKFIGIDPCEDNGEYTDDNVAGSDGHFKIPDGTPRVGFPQSNSDGSVEMEMTEIIDLSSFNGLMYEAAPWFSYNVQKEVLSAQMYTRITSILQEVVDAAPKDNPLKMATLNSYTFAEAPTPAEEVAGEAPTEEVAGPAQTQESSDEEEIPGSD